MNDAQNYWLTRSYVPHVSVPPIMRHPHLCQHQEKAINITIHSISPSCKLTTIPLFAAEILARPSSLVGLRGSSTCPDAVAKSAFFLVSSRYFPVDLHIIGRFANLTRFSSCSPSMRCRAIRCIDNILSSPRNLCELQFVSGELKEFPRTAARVTDVEVIIVLQLRLADRRSKSDHQTKIRAIIDYKYPRL
jgi:hypothetical protein